LNRKEGLFLSALLLILEMFAFKSVGATGGSSSIVWVKPGDFNEYSYDVTLFSNDTNAMLSTHPEYQWLSAIDTCRVLVENVSGTNITAKFIYTFKNGTTDTITRWADVATNQVSDSEAAKGYFIALNSTIFNETLTRAYLGANMEVRHLSGGFVNGTLTWPINGTEHTLLYNYTLDYYVNNSTGTMLEYTETISNKNGTSFSEMTSHIIVVQSNVFPEFPLTLILLILIAAIILMAAILMVAMAYKRKVRDHPEVDLRKPKKQLVTDSSTRAGFERLQTVLDEAQRRYSKIGIQQTKVGLQKA
jgi:hypothetical protein